MPEMKQARKQSSKQVNSCASKQEPKTLSRLEAST